MTDTIVKNGLRSRLALKWGDCDPAGIIYYPRYFEMFDDHTSQTLAALTGLTQVQMQARYGIEGWPMLDSHARFLSLGAFGDIVTIETRVVRVGRSSFDLEHQIAHLDGKLLVECADKRVWVGRDPQNPKAMKSMPIPGEVLDRLDLG